MEVRFINAEGKCLWWDGLLWSSAEVPELAASLNRVLLEQGPGDGRLLHWAEKQARETLGQVEMTVADLTGMPQENFGEDLLPEEEQLADGEEPWQSRRHDRPPETGAKGSALTQAQDYLGGSLCPNGAPDGDAPEEDWEEPERQWSQLREWCEAQDMMVQAPGPNMSGGREHDVIFEPGTESWIKYTKPGLAGYMVDWHGNGRPYLRNALPHEYLARLTRQNELFMDAIQLAGLWRDGTEGWRIVTTQPHVRGRRATMAEISEGMLGMGFVKMGWTGIGYEDSTSWRIGRMGIWDVHPANVVMGENGVLVPVDVIIAELPHGYPPRHFHPEITFSKLSPP